MGITTDAKPRKRQHRAPCHDCPWRREALPGWLGGSTADQWLADAHGEGLALCHTCGNQQCAGMAIYRANVAKTPRHAVLLRLPADRDKVFATPNEFKEHHERRTASKTG